MISQFPEGFDCSCEYAHACGRRNRGLTKNTAQLQTLFALSNLWMVRRRLLAQEGCV